MMNLITLADATLYGDAAAAGGVMAMLAVFGMFILAMVLITYIYMALAIMFTAKKLNTEPAWLAWIPIANLYLVSKMAKMPWWPILLIIGTVIPIIGFIFQIALAVYVVIWTWKICEARKKPGWWAILTIIPIVNFVIWGILAWSD